jgi:hypothetical protein
LHITYFAFTYFELIAYVVVFSKLAYVVVRKHVAGLGGSEEQGRDGVAQDVLAVEEHLVT